jgi:hypothetical protein
MVTKKNSVMKAIRSIIIISAAFTALLTTSCKKSFFTEVNNNPNSPAAVTPSSLLSTVEGSLAYTQGGEMSRFTSMLTQQTLGAARQAQGYYNYTFTTQDFDPLWGNLYSQTMENNYLLMQQADENGYHAYSGISRIIMAYSLQITVDNWGDVPYSEAFKGVDNFHPAYDEETTLYGTISSLVDDGIAEITNADLGVLVPGGEDFIYNGDLSKWEKFAHGIKARLAIHQSKTDPSQAQVALDEIALSLTSNDDNAQYIFGSTETSANPWYQFNEQRGDISFASSTLAVELTALNDPRYPIFIDDAGDPDGLGLAAYYGSINSPVEFIVYDELEFMEAEAILRTSGDIASAQEAYQEGITANMEKLGVAESDITTYLTANGTLPSTVDEAIKQVAFQAWIALYLNPEAFNTYRRTDSPELVPVAGDQVPRRFLYPQTEYSYNADHVPASTLYTPKLFWDN